MKVTIVDYGMGNIFSVSRAFEHCGATVQISSKPDEILAAERLVLPGVGAFEQGMAELKQRDLVATVRQFASSGARPFLGICLGMQMLFQTSEEAPGVEGLGLMDGTVVKIPKKSPTGDVLRVPHIGWSPLRWSESARGKIMGPSAKGTPIETYFVHSYMAAPASAVTVAATVDYQGLDIVAVVMQGSMFGMQFHPEKSGPSGLAILREFLRRDV